MRDIVTYTSNELKNMTCYQVRHCLQMHNHDGSVGMRRKYELWHPWQSHGSVS